MNIQPLLAAIDKLQDRMVKATRGAAERCREVHLALYGDGSGRIVYRWSMEDLLTTILTADQNETFELFDSLAELEVLLREKQVL